MRRSLGLIACIIVFVAAACADSQGDATTSSSTTSTELTGSSSSTTSTSTAETTTSSQANSLIEDSCHEGSSPATFDDQSGVYATMLTAIDPTVPSLSFDVVQWLVGDDAEDAYHEEYPDDPHGPPNDYFIKNENPSVRTAPVAADVEVALVRLDEDADADLDPGTFDELPDYLAGQPGPDDYLSFNPYWLTFDAGTITGICEQFIP